MTQYRARTGCLTCRDRHVKCDEALPRCRNCAKSNRSCERGIRLNFIDIQTPSSHLPASLPPGTQLVFQDESQAVALDYKVNSATTKATKSRANASLQASVPRRDARVSFQIDDINPEQEKTPEAQKLGVPLSRIIQDLDEGLLMEVFVEKIAPWLDCLDTNEKPVRHLSGAHMLLLMEKVHKRFIFLRLTRTGPILGNHVVRRSVPSARNDISLCRSMPQYATRI
ncbi:hypothetical protein F4808DRAFT_421748, partial [Astrocystis sublimbata]